MCGNFNVGSKRHVLLSTDGSQLVLTRRETRVRIGHKIFSDACRNNEVKINFNVFDNNYWFYYLSLTILSQRKMPNMQFLITR